MPARPHLVPPEGTFIIMQQRGHDRILFEVNAGKMVSIRVEPDPGELADTDNTDEATFPHMQAKGSC
ncbi:hypothetical protein [Massilia sp. CCM 8734]|uniref:hypothetical protein n=1 Tax=Massilia sp. CCM 8734 TaxID=2609283 RepID=UPI001420E1B2|nr:hypothetical protein [Massilia sp. CCM 8734]NHZ94303.1 hypothetical protein [Massilia sp. CCM 8734]